MDNVEAQKRAYIYQAFQQKQQQQEQRILTKDYTQHVNMPNCNYQLYDTISCQR